MLHAIRRVVHVFSLLTVLHKIVQPSGSERENDSNGDDGNSTNDDEDIYDHNDRNNDKDKRQST